MRQQRTPTKSRPFEVEELVKVLWLRKKQNLSYQEIATKLNRSDISIRKVILVIDQDYWTKTPKELLGKYKVYVEAVPLAKNYLVQNKDPFTENLDPNYPVDFTLDKQNTLKQNVTETATNLTYEEGDKLVEVYRKFQEDIISTVTTLTTEVVKVKLEQVLIENEALRTENRNFREKIESLTKDLFKAKQTSLSDSLAISMSQIKPLAHNR